MIQRRLADVAQIADLAWDLVTDSNLRHFSEATAAMTDAMLPLPALSPVCGKTVCRKKFEVVFCRRTAAFWCCARSSNAFASLIGLPPA
jgi:hypothetical protein